MSCMSALVMSVESTRKSRQVGNPTEQAVKLRKQRESVRPQPRILVHHHHLIEERIDRRAQLRQPPQRVGILALRHGSSNSLLERAHRIEQTNLSGIFQCLDLDLL